MRIDELELLMQTGIKTLGDLKHAKTPTIVTSENYFTPETEMEYMGSSQFKEFMDCEARALARIKGEYAPEPSQALLVGSYIDAHFSKALDLFKAKNPDIFKRDGNLKSEYLQANEIIAKIESDPEMVKHLSGETQVIMTGYIAGVPFKIKVDSLLPDMTVDLKIMRDFADIYSDGEWKQWFKCWNYDIQAAIYQTIRAQNDGGEIKPFRIVAATKQSGADIGIFEFKPETLDEALENVKLLAPRFHAIKQGLEQPKRCENCEYCRITKKITEIQYI